MLRNHPRKVTAAVAAVLLIGGAGAATAAALSDSPSGERETLLVPGVAAPIAEAPIRPAPLYSAAERSTQKPTARALEAQSKLAVRFPDVAGRAVRGLKAADGTQAWVVSGSRHTCFGADNSDGTGYACAPNGVAHEGISVAERRQDGTERAVILVPDPVASISAEGRRVGAKNNVVVVEHRTGAAIQANPSDGRAPFRVGSQ